MNAESKPSDYSDAQVEVKVEPAGTITKVQASGAKSDQWQQIRDQAVSILSELPEYVTGFFNQYQRPIVTIGLVIAAFVTLRVTLAVLEALNDIPLLAPTFELIGIGYTAWFVYRYLLRAANRQELSSQITSLKDQVVGRNSNLS